MAAERRAARGALRQPPCMTTSTRLSSPTHAGGGLEATAGEVGRRGGSEVVGVLGSTADPELGREGGVGAGKCWGERRRMREIGEEQRPWAQMAATSPKPRGGQE
jgi:hypothetical protein